jgi:hypothetical protein
MGNMRIINYFKNVKSLSMSLTIVALIVYSFSLFHIKYEIGYLGAIKGLPLLFFVSLSFLTIASAMLWISPRSHGKLLTIQIVIFIFILYMTPLILWGPGSSQSNVSGLYGRIGWADYINRYGHIDSTVIWTHAWPAESLLNSAMMQIFGVEKADTIIIFQYVLWLVLSTCFVFCFLYNILGKEKVNHVFAGLWIFLLASPFLCYLQASQIGFLLLLAILILLFNSRTFNGTSYPLSTIILMCIIFVSLPVAHLLSSLVGLGLIFGIIIITKKFSFWGIAWMLLFTIIVAWSMYITVNIFNAKIPAFLQGAFRFDIAFNQGVVERFVGDSSHQTIVFLRLFTVGIFLISALLGAIFGFITKENIKRDIFIIIIFAGIGAVAILISGSYQFELVQRLYIYILPAILYFVIKLLNKKTTVILIVLLLASLPLHYIYQLGNAESDFITSADVSAANFFFDNTHLGTVIGAQLVNPIGSMKNQEDYTITPLRQLKWSNNTPLINSNSICYIYLRKNDEEIYHFLYNDSSLIVATRNHLNHGDNFDLIYINSSYIMYYYVNNY